MKQEVVVLTDAGSDGAGETVASVRGTPVTDREIHRQVWHLAWPSVTAMLLQSFNSLMDTFFVGHLPEGAQALAATGVGGGIVFLLVSLAMGVTVGTTALVARFTGAQEPVQTARATGQSVSLVVLLALLCGVPAYIWQEQIVGLMLDPARNPQATRLCVAFLGAALLATLPLFIWNVLQAAFRGVGDARTPMRITGAAIGVHVLGDWLLIYGHSGVPRMGVVGAGTALALSWCAGMLLFGAAAWRHATLRTAFQWRHLKPDLAWYGRILRIGVPASVQALVRTVSMMLFTGMLARTMDGAAAVAALQIGIRAESIAFMPGFGYGIAASALVGQALGARDPDRAERAARVAMWQALGVMCLMAILFVIGARSITRVFSADPQVIGLGVAYLRINALCEPFLAPGMVLTGALQGAGETVKPTLITLITMVFLRLPLASLLMFTWDLQAVGAWWAMTATTVVGGLMTLRLFQAGHWKRVCV